MICTFYALLFSLHLSAQEWPFLNSGKATSLNSDIASTDTLESRFGFVQPLSVTESQIWSAALRGQIISLPDSLVIADRGYTIPKDFGGADIGIGGAFPNPSGQQGFHASIGSTGRQLFNQNNSRTFTANYFREWKKDNGDAWYFLVNYSNNRTSWNGIPIPGFAYAINRQTYRLMLGAPFITASWSPGDWRIMLMGSPFAIFQQAAYVIHAPWQILTSVGWYPRSFQNLAPAIDNERLLFDKKEWSTGFAFAPAPPIAVSLLYVYHFDRRFFIGESVSQRKSSAVELADAGGVQFKLRFAF